MPVYEFRCLDTGKKFEVRVKSIADYDPESITSPFTGSKNITRLIGRVIVLKSGKRTLDQIAQGDPSTLNDFENASPQELAHQLRTVADEYAGESEGAVGDEFHEVVDRLERGQSPEQIESEMPVLKDGASPGFGTDSPASEGD